MKIGQSLLRVCRNHAHSGRLYARTNNMVFKKFQKIQSKMPFSMEKLEKPKFRKKKKKNLNKIKNL